MNKHYTIAVELTLQGPLFTCGGELADPTMDASMSRDRHGHFMFPFSLIKGRVRDSLKDLGNGKEVLERWFGRKNADGAFEPERGRLSFSDFHTEEPGDPDQDISRILIDAETGTVKRGMLQMVQAPFGFGQQVKFAGSVTFIGSEQESKEIKQLLDHGFRWTEAFGAYRSVGFGKVTKVKCTCAPTAKNQSPAPANANQLPLTLELDRPLCVVGKKHSSNHFESLETIGGAVLKGATARLISQVSGCGPIIKKGCSKNFPKTCEHFASIRFAEAKPRCGLPDSAKARPIVPPLSTVRSVVKKKGEDSLTNTDEYYDVAFCKEPCLLDGAAPAFLVDWKGEDFGTVFGRFGWPEVPKERRTRTAIFEKNFRAKDEQLFSYGLVLPDKSNGGTQLAKIVWETEIGLEKVLETDREAVRKELQVLLQWGLPNIGKTRAVGAITWLEKPRQPTVKSQAAPDNHVIVTLQTECLMTNPDDLTDDPGSLQKAYEAFWKGVSPELTLETFFATQSLYGGYVSKRANRDFYEPFLLTDRGSTFVLSHPAEGDPTDLIEKWQQQGLPVAQWVQERYATGEGGDLWQRCPYMPHVGFGQVEVNLESHWQSQLQVAKTGASV